MEFRTRCCLISSLFALTFAAVPALAQEEPSPASSEDTRPDPSREQAPFAQSPDAPRGQPVQPGFPGQGGRPVPGMLPAAVQPRMGFNPMIIQSPEMAKKMRAIMVLRQMWQLRLTAKDINAILLPLRELAEAEKSLQTRSERILEEERRALLTADPDGDPPDGSGDLMQRENDLFRIKSDDTWRAIDKSIGRSKTNGIRRLLGMGGQNSGGGLGGRSGASADGGSGGRIRLPGGDNPALSSPGGGGIDLPGGEGGIGGGGAVDGGGGLDIPDDDFAQPPAGGGGIGGGNGKRPGGNRAQGGGGFSNAPRPGGGLGGGAPMAQQNSPFNSQVMPGMPGRGIMRISITEFVGLLGEKLAAMRK